MKAVCIHFSKFLNALQHDTLGFSSTEGDVIYIWKECARVYVGECVWAH